MSSSFTSTSSSMVNYVPAAYPDMMSSFCMWTMRSNLVINGSVSSKFGSFVVEKPEKTLIAFQVVTLDLLCGCSKNGDVVTYRVRQGDTLYIICSQFNTDINRTIKLNQITNPNLIHDGEVIFIPEPESEESVVSSLSSSKITVFPYQEVCSATSNFTMSSKIDQGSYGSVYPGKLKEEL
ncbi:hypothetical protein SLE2022_186340 [Rubroshorea leprosula]